MDAAADTARIFAQATTKTIKAAYVRTYTAADRIADDEIAHVRCWIIKEIARRDGTKAAADFVIECGPEAAADFIVECAPEAAADFIGSAS